MVLKQSYQCCQLCFQIPGCVGKEVLAGPYEVLRRTVQCTLYGKALLFFFSPITLQVTSHSSPILTSIVSLSMKKSSKFKGLQTNSPLHLSGGNLSTLEIQKSSGSLTSRKGERVALLKTLFFFDTSTVHLLKKRIIKATAQRVTGV